MPPPCEHLEFAAEVDVNRLTDDNGTLVIGYCVDLRVRCRDCDERFVFIGAPVGYDPTRPAMGLDGQEMHLPIRPDSSDPSFGLGMAGYAVRLDDQAGRN